MGMGMVVLMIVHAMRSVLLMALGHGLARVPDVR